MALNVENASGNNLALDDLGITLTTGEISDLALRGAVQDIINSAQAGEELSNLITAGSLIVKDPADGVSNLSIADGLICVLSYADPNYRVGAGARLVDISDVDASGLSDTFVLRYNNGTGNFEVVNPSTVAGDIAIGELTDVTITTPVNDQVLTYSGGTWINAAGGSTQNLYETFAGDSGTPTTASSPTDTLTIAGGINIATVASSDTITVNSANIWNTIAGDSGSITPNIALDTVTFTGGTGITTAVAGDVVTITNDSPNVDQNIWLNIDADTGGPVAANTTTDTLTIAGGAGISTSITGDVLTISTGVGDVPVAFARRTTPMPITSSFVTITFDTTDVENDDTVVDHDNVTNTSRITVKEAGLYEVFFQTSGLVFTANGEGFYTVETRLIKNGVLVAVPGGDILSSGYTGGAATSTEVNAPSTNLILDLVANDYLEVQIRFIVLNGVAGTVANATSDSTFWVAKLAGARGADGDPGPTGSGSNINVYDEGILVPNSPFSQLNFIGDSVTVTDGGGGQADITISGGGSTVEFDRQKVQSTINYQTSNGAAQDITNASLTTTDLGGPGDYIITFSCEYIYNEDDNTAQFGIDVGGSEVVSMRASGNDGKAATWMNFSMTHLAQNVTSGTIINVTVRSNGGDTVTVQSRELVIDGVLSANVL